MQEYPDNNLKEEDELKLEPSLTRSHKFAVAGLAFFSVFIIILWSVQFKNNLKPTTYNPEVNQTATCSGSECNNSDDLKIKDTDGDGITDYDEFNLYDTSPYLEDSDSDGFSDKSEIDSGNDPNCPNGRECNSSSSLEDNSKLNDSPSTGNDNNLNINDASSDNEKYKDVLSGQGDTDTLREMLINAGMDKNILDQISDKDLIKSYQDTLSK